MKIKKYFVGFIASTMLVSTCYCIKPVEAIDFSKDESKYMSLCASGKLTNSNKKTCEEFNSYLKAKNKKLKKDLENQKSAAASTTQTLDSVQKKLNSLNSDISSKEAEIQYVETSIQNAQADIDKDNQEIKDRMYVMQSYMNENTFINYIFGADNFTDMLSRIDSFNTLTSSDQDLIAQMLEKKKEIENQKVTLENAKAVLEEQKKEQAAIQVQYETLLEEQKKQIASTQDAIYDYGAASESLAAAIDKFNAEAYETKPSTARPAPPASNNTNSNNSNNTGNNNSNNNNNNSSSNNNNSSNNNSNSNTNNNTNNSNTNNTTSSNLGYKIYEVARSKLGCRYYWGANGPNMFDCSGLVYYCLNHAGKSVGRTTAAGYSSMFSGVSWSNSQTGDLACFGTGSVTHIGIVMLNSDGTRSLIHCGGGGSHTFGNDPNACVKISDFQPGSYYYKRIITIRHVS